MPDEKRLFTASRLLGKLVMGCARTDLQASRGRRLEPKHGNQSWLEEGNSRTATVVIGVTWRSKNTAANAILKRHPSRRPGGSRPRKEELSYLIQKHDATRLHYDFRLELDGVLLSWAVTKGPSLNPADKRLAVRTEDHPLSYGTFEGTIPQGEYGGGTVMMWDEGTWEPKGDPRAGLEKGHLSFVLHGERLKGGWGLIRMRGDGKRENWLLVKENDDGSAQERSEREIS